MRSRLKRATLGAAIAFVYLYAFPYFAKIHSANELPRLYLTMAMADEGTLAIDTGVRRWGATADVSPSGGHQYSNKAPGSSMLALPGYLALREIEEARGSEPSLAEIMWVCRVTTGIIPTLLFLLLLWRFLERWAPDEDVRAAVIVAYALGSMAMTYSLLFIAHQLSAVAIGTCFILSVWVVEDQIDVRWMLAAGFAAGAAPLIDYQAAFAGVPLAIYLLAHLPRRGRDGIVGIALGVAGAAVPIAVLLGYHWLAFGHPLRTGYDASVTFAHFHQRGFLGLDQFRPAALYGSTLAPDNGLLFFSPFWALALWGWVELARRRRWWMLSITLSVAALYIAFISSLSFWRGGWQLGPRYIVAMLPFALVPLAAALTEAEQRWWTRGIAWGLIAASVVVYGTSSIQFPHFPDHDFTNPLYEITFRLYGDGYAPYSAGWWLGLRGFWAQLPALVALGVALSLILWPVRKKRRVATLAVSILVAAGLLFAASLAPRGGAGAERTYHRITRVYPR